ncbi:PREDICTED: beta-hexosaminidase subunit beta-like [Nicrophorus vespilloides]|uniref:Beta-hexosaminidase n=1 Tax=Nicrophorus vespilloides TaxID=110193 RepID=A0ABM1MAQ8_NICVS|nr:PREDICTED: beta-hexosaminidase subunit beta-like [Nicrophorus vespilloides]
MLFTTLTLLLFFLSQLHCYVVDPGPQVKATKGFVWPKPQQVTRSQEYFVINPKEFRFKNLGKECAILVKAFQRYGTMINVTNSLERRGRLTEISVAHFHRIYDKTNYLGSLSKLYVDLENPCKDDEYPSAVMDESYEINITNSMKPMLKAKSIWGILRGLETFSQLIHYASNEYTLIVNSTWIKDFPRFPYRGLMLDTSRHFIPVYSIYNTLDAMSYNKLNVFHWHIVDDQSFPYQSTKFPELSDKGAYHPISQVYTLLDIKRVIEFARLRGIRVIPEFDTPGHTRSWGEGIKDILTPCYDTNGKATGKYGPMNPASKKLFKFLRELFKEIRDVFPDSYLHLGGDEVEFECWDSNEEVKEFMKMKQIKNYKALENYYIQELIRNIVDITDVHVVWEEVFVNGVELTNDTIVHVWKNDGFTVLKNVTGAGKPALLSACWYLDHLKSGGDWNDFYDCDPHDFHGSQEQMDLVLGGEACMWAEVVNGHNIGSRIWPRASATAEKLWSKKNADEFSKAAQRLEEHTCRMNFRGIPAQPPNGPGFCL